MADSRQKAGFRLAGDLRLVAGGGSALEFPDLVAQMLGFGQQRGFTLVREGQAENLQDEHKASSDTGGDGQREFPSDCARHDTTHSTQHRVTMGARG